MAREGIHYAWKEGMTKGDFAFILFEFSVNTILQRKRYPFRWFVPHYEKNFKDFKKVREEFGSVLIFGPKTPQSNYRDFEKKLKEELSKAPFFSDAYERNISRTTKMKKDGEVNSLLIIFLRSRSLLLETATWAVSTQIMQDHFGAKGANWLVGYRNCQPRFQFHQTKSGRALERA